MALFEEKSKEAKKGKHISIQAKYIKKIVSKAILIPIGLTTGKISLTWLQQWLPFKKNF